jgi:hypothetical protein
VRASSLGWITLATEVVDPRAEAGELEWRNIYGGHMRIAVVLVMVAAATGCKSKTEDAPAAAKNEPTAAAAPTFGRTNLPSDQRCYEFDAETTKAKGWSWVKAMSPSQGTLEPNVACPTDKLLGTCVSGDVKIRMYTGERTDNCSSCPDGHMVTWSVESATQYCADLGGTFK